MNYPTDRIARVWTRNPVGGWEVFGAYDLSTTLGQEGYCCAIEWVAKIAPQEHQVTFHIRTNSTNESEIVS